MASQNVALVRMADGRVITTSYGIPVAVFVPGDGYYRTDRHYSSTTTRHARMYGRQNGTEPSEVSHGRFKAMVAPMACTD